MTELEKLQLSYQTYKWNYDRCHPFHKDSYFVKMKVCWEKIRAYKLKHCPESLEQPKHNLNPIPFVPIDTWCEQFENFNK